MDRNQTIKLQKCKHNKVRVGWNHIYFLDPEGSVWVCGYNIDAQLGLGHTKTPVKPITCIDFLFKHSIRMKEIEC